LAVLSLGAHVLAEQRYVTGTVTTDQQKAVPRAIVDVDAEAPSDVTTDSGKFHFPVPPLKVGFAYTFSVLNWVVIDPCVLARGRLYLPDPDAEPITIRVLRSQDKRLLSSQTLGCLVKERFARFQASSAVLHPGSAFWQRGKQNAAMLIPASRCEACLQLILYQPMVLDLGVFSGQKADDMTSDEEYWSQIAIKFGFTAQELTSALNKWAATPTDDPYQQGLISLYIGSYSLAAKYLRTSIDTAQNARSEVLVLLARADFEQRLYEQAISDLQQVLEAHPGDELVLANLQVVIAAAAPGSPRGLTATPN